MRHRAFVPDYTSFTPAGAAWLVQHRPSVRLVGIDYLTVATYDDLKTPHEHLLGAVRLPYLPFLPFFMSMLQFDTLDYSKPPDSRRV